MMELEGSSRGLGAGTLGNLDVTQCILDPLLLQAIPIPTYL
jgi:hypothetical protein